MDALEHLTKEHRDAAKLVDRVLGHKTGQEVETEHELVNALPDERTHPHSGTQGA